MQYKTFGDTIVVRLDIKDEIVSSIQKVCEMENVKAASITGIGATNHAVFGILKPSDKKFYPVEMKEDMEITGLVGNVSTLDGKPYLHLHISMGNIEGKVFGGHLKEAYISVTGEIYIRKIDAKVGRKVCPVTGINIIDFEG